MRESTLRHRPEIVRETDVSGRTYRMRCTCGASGGAWAARRLAQVDLNEHVLALPRVPAAQQCRDPARHGRRHWEPCAVCEHQTVLFDPAATPRM